MKTIILLLAVILTGCASTGSQKPARKPITPPLPQLPKGFKFKKATTNGSSGAMIIHPMGQSIDTNQARFAPASITPTVTPGTGILQAPELWSDPDPTWGKLFLARAYQGPNTVLTVEWAHTPTGPWNLVTEWACWPSEQVILVSTSGNFEQLFMRGRHTPCTPGFQPASAARLSFVKDFKSKSGPLKAAKIEGHQVADGFTLWKVLP